MIISFRLTIRAEVHLYDFNVLARRLEAAVKIG